MQEDTTVTSNATQVYSFYVLCGGGGVSDEQVTCVCVCACSGIACITNSIYPGWKGGQRMGTICVWGLTMFGGGPAENKGFGGCHLPAGTRPTPPCFLAGSPGCFSMECSEKMAGDRQTVGALEAPGQISRTATRLRMKGVIAPWLSASPPGHYSADLHAWMRITCRSAESAAR